MADNSVFLYKLDVGDRFTTTLDKNKVFEITGRKGDTTYVKEVATGKDTWFDIPDAFVIPVDESATYQKKRFLEPAYVYNESVMKESAATQKIRTADDLYNWMVEYARKNKSKGSTSLQFLFGNGNNIIIAWDFKNNRGIEHDNDKETLTEFVYKFMDPVIKARGLSDIFEVDPDTGRFQQIKESRKGKRSMKHLTEAEERKSDYLAIVKRFRSDITKYIDMCENAIEHGRKIDNYQRDLGQDYATVFAAEMLRYNLAVENKVLVESKKVLKEDGPQKIVIKQPWGAEIKDYKAGDPIPAGVKFKIFNANDTQKIEDYADSLFEAYYAKWGKKYFCNLGGSPAWGPVKDLAIKFASEKDARDYMNNLDYLLNDDADIQIVKESVKLSEDFYVAYSRKGNGNPEKYMAHMRSGKIWWTDQKDEATRFSTRSDAEKALKKLDYYDALDLSQFPIIQEGRIAKGYENLNADEKARHLLSHPSSKYMNDLKSENITERAIRKAVKEMLSKPNKQDPEFIADINEEGEAAAVASTTTANVANPELPLKLKEGYKLVDQSTGSSKSFSTIEDLAKFIDKDQGLLEFPLKTDSDIEKWNNWQKRDMGPDALKIVKESQDEDYIVKQVCAYAKPEVMKSKGVTPEILATAIGDYIATAPASSDIFNVNYFAKVLDKVLANGKVNPNKFILQKVNSNCSKLFESLSSKNHKFKPEELKIGKKVTIRTPRGDLSGKITINHNDLYGDNPYTQDMKGSTKVTVTYDHDHHSADMDPNDMGGNEFILECVNKALKKKLTEGYEVIFPSGASEKLKTIADVNKFVNGVLHMKDKNASDVQLTDDMLDKWNKENDIPLVIVKESCKGKKKKVVKEESWSEINAIINDDAEEVEAEEGMNTAKRFKDAIYHGKNITPETYVRISKNMQKSGSDNFWDLVEAILSSDTSLIDKLVRKYDK